MSHECVTDEISEQAALYALGLLEPQEALAFQKHLRAGCAACEAELHGFRDTALLLPLALPETKPHPRARDKLLASIKSAPGPQVWKAWTDTISASQHIVRAEQGTWEPVGLEGISVKQLYVDPVQDTVTMLVRMDPGARYPMHRHAAPEQCLVLEGDLRIGDLVFRAGDYRCAAAESIDQPSYTEQGCLLLIVSSQHDQLLA
ncbi:MAG: cupin domain-containing protein [Acidobacteria bacterium]|nr:cupin domain-containing protein [Acidobacteriota bacterium]